MASPREITCSWSQQLQAAPHGHVSGKNVHDGSVKRSMHMSGARCGTAGRAAATSFTRGTRVSGYEGLASLASRKRVCVWNPTDGRQRHNWTRRGDVRVRFSPGGHMQQTPRLTPNMKKSSSQRSPTRNQQLLTWMLWCLIRWRTFERHTRRCCLPGPRCLPCVLLPGHSISPSC